MPVKEVMKFKWHRLWFYGSLLAWLLFVLTFDPMAGHALNVDDRYTGDTPCDPCAEIGASGKLVGQEPEESMPWFHERKSAATDQIIYLWIEYPSPIGVEAFVNPASAPVVFSGMLYNPHTFGKNPNDVAYIEPAVNYQPVNIPFGRYYPDSTSGSSVSSSIWIFPAGGLILFVVLLLTSAGLVINDKYVFDELRQNFLRRDDTLSWERARIEAKLFVNLNIKVLLIVFLYLAGNAFLFFMLQEFSHPAQNVMKGISFDQNRSMDDRDADGDEDLEIGYEAEYYEFLIPLLLYLGVTGYFFLIRPARSTFRRYKRSLLRRRYFYSGLDQ